MSEIFHIYIFLIAEFHKQFGPETFSDSTLKYCSDYLVSNEDEIDDSTVYCRHRKWWCQGFFYEICLNEKIAKFLLNVLLVFLGNFSFYCYVAKILFYFIFFRIWLKLQSWCRIYLWFCELWIIQMGKIQSWFDVHQETK